MARPDVTGNTLIRSSPCEVCGARMLWTQSAFTLSDGSTHAAYECDNGHVIDPADTAQCPNCGLHDTIRTEGAGFKCQRCGNAFSMPR